MTLTSTVMVNTSAKIDEDACNSSVYTSVKFDEDVCNGLVSLTLIRSKHDRLIQKHTCKTGETTDTLLYLHRKTAHFTKDRTLYSKQVLDNLY